MHITIIDDSFPYDASVLGGPAGAMEKAVAHLALALTKRDNSVQVFTQCKAPKALEAVSWSSMDDPRPDTTDVLVACRRPSLLAGVSQPRARVLWANVPGQVLLGPGHKERLKAFDAHVVLHSQYHKETWIGEDIPPNTVIPFGVAPVFLERKQAKASDPPIAVVTCDPRHGMNWLVKMWINDVHPIAPKAEMHIYSAALHAMAGGAQSVDDAIGATHKVVIGAKHRNIKVMAPLDDATMIDVFRSARVHMHPGHALDMACGTLQESQSLGVPVVTRAIGAGAEQVRDGMSGVVSNDPTVFATAVLKLLNNDSEFRRMSSQARFHQGVRSWDKAAGEFEALFETLIGDNQTEAA